ncbi:Fungal specific transcription factor [Yamadazyma tenuis]|uniref:Zn(2)-C6 fungal-type domain-containing protein n=1 Tax=Candida tenuis (strain ATCC 10573 / BCRC 21748 / CBS 615 / JCM 9827 / NBRC 10315 / NRRL Y-1498 / VKM Y-70) TaxID=590646 RepID=G3BBR0_CANTC|nr:uncharacterized protein CANTEDRAFT_136150 [Yamadazyma tenuis ATCC 10573]EGV62214.1 hypothetical protein CANTEDRAFT_136150 [Yamadazyma tenuis ATCC 10573]WEJ93473.1 Fungal specific transcription factor [Yamadazyma tenuis]
MNQTNNPDTTSSYTSYHQSDPSGGGENGVGPKSDQDFHNNNFMDSNWANSLLMDDNHLLYDMHFPPHIEGATPTNNIVQSIQYQNHVSPEINDPSDKSKIPTPDSQTQTQNHAKQAPKARKKQGPRLESTPASAASSASATPNNLNAKQSKPRRPCDHCRRKKTKCVLIPGTANCVQCEARSLGCTFVDVAIKRKPLDIPEEMGSVAKRPKEEYSGSGPSPIVAPNVPIRDVAPVQDYSSMNNSLLKKTLSLQFPRSSFYIGPSSFIYDINLLNLVIDAQNKQRGLPVNSGRIEQINLNDAISLRKVSADAQFVLKDDQSPQSYQTMSNDVDSIEKFVAPHGQILIDLYFRIVHPSYPILHKKVFLEKYSRTHREFSAPLLAAVYVLAIQWWDYDPSLNRFPKPNVEMILKIGLNNYLLEIMKRPKLSAVQAGLLLLQCKHIVRVSKNNQENNNTQQASQTLNDLGYSDWVLCSQVIALAEELGLGLDCTDWKLPKWERGLRKRLAWAVFMEDKWLSLKNARPSHINSMNWVVTLLLEEDFPEKHGDGDLKEGSSDIDNGKKIFIALIELSQILSEILDSFYSMKAMNELKDDIAEILKLAKPIQLGLRNWYHSLPIELQMSSVQTRKLCSNGYLQLAYFATELTLHRKIITAIHNQNLAGKVPPKEMVAVCRQAAKTRLLAAIDFVRDLKPEHIHSFWHSSAASNFTLIGTFASILFASAPTKEESIFFRDQIFNYRWILKISSKGFDQVGDALSQLDLVLNHIPGLLSESSDLPMVLPTVQDMPIQRPESAQSTQRQLSNPAISPFTMTSPVNFNGHLGHKRSNSSHNKSEHASPYETVTGSGLGIGTKPRISSPHSSSGFSPRETTRGVSSFNISSAESNSPGGERSKHTSPIITKSLVNTRRDDTQ